MQLWIPDIICSAGAIFLAGYFFHLGAQTNAPHGVAPGVVMAACALWFTALVITTDPKSESHGKRIQRSAPLWLELAALFAWYALNTSVSPMWPISFAVVLIVIGFLNMWIGYHIIAKD